MYVYIHFNVIKDFSSTNNYFVNDLKIYTKAVTDARQELELIASSGD